MQWSPTNRGLDFPYICQSNCAVGYVWRIQARKCVKALRSDLTRATYGKAEVMCAKDNARLLSITTCDMLKGLQDDIWAKFPSLTENYWVGFYSGAMATYFDQSRISDGQKTSFRADGRVTVAAGGNLANCATNNYAIPFIDASGNAKTTIGDGGGYYASFMFSANKDAKIKLTAHDSNKAN